MRREEQTPHFPPGSPRANAFLLNGNSVVLRPGTIGSALAGAGLRLNLEGDVYLRVEGCYDSISVRDLDVWRACSAPA